MLFIAAAAWYLLKEFAPLLRPLLLAVFLGYIILPIHRRLTRRIPAVASIVVLAGASVGLLVLLAFQLVGSAAELNEEMPRLIDRTQKIIHGAEKYYTEHLPPWLGGEATEVARGQHLSVSRISDVVTTLAGAASDALSELFLVAIYLISS